MNVKDSSMNAMLNALAALFPSGAIVEVYKGTQPADANTAISSQTLLASITTGANFGSASARSAAKGGTWEDTSANAGAGDAPTFVRIKNAADTERVDLTAGVGSGEISVNGTITAGQDVTISTFAFSG
jgi:hypothetical protein